MKEKTTRIKRKYTRRIPVTADGAKASAFIAHVVDRSAPSELDVIKTLSEMPLSAAKRVVEVATILFQ